MRGLAALLLDRHLRRLARMRNPVESRLARLLLRLDEASGYLDLGFARLKDYAAERLGLSARRVHLFLSLARRLRDLPLTVAAFEAGTVSESQVRLLLRVVSPETEAAWLERAAALNVRLLEREVRGALAASQRPGDGAESSTAQPSPCAEGREPAEDDGDMSADGETIGILVPERLRARWEEALELARRSAGAPEPVWRCAEFIAADYLAGVPDLAGLLTRSLSDDRPDDPTDPAASAAPPAPAASATPAGPEVQTFAGAGLDDTARDHDSAGGLNSCFGDHGDDTALRQDTDLFEEILRGLEEEAGARRWCPPAEGLDVVLPESVRDDPSDSPRRLDDRLVACIRLRQDLSWHQGRLLRLFAGRRLYRELGFLSFSRYCRERAGLGVRRAWHLISLERRLWLLPGIAQAYRSGSLSWVKAAAIARVATERTEQDWLHLARSVTVRRLLDEVAVAQAEVDQAEIGRDEVDRAHASGGPTGLDTDGGVQLSAPALRAGSCHQSPQQSPQPFAWSGIRFWAPLEVASLWQHAFRVCRALARSEGADRSLEDWECLDRLLDSFFSTWEVRGGAAWRRRYKIFERDGWRCRVPGCSSRRSLQVHHVLFRSQGGSDDDRNLVVLCATHHLQGIHRGRLRCHALPGGLLAWELGPDPVRGPVARYVEDVVWEAAQRLAAS